MRNANSLANRIIAMTLCVVMVMGMLPTGVIAEDNSDIYGVVESLTEGVSINETGKDMRVTFAGDLDWVAKDESIGRNEDGWWIGLRVTAPSTLNIETAKYKRGSQERYFKDYNDSADDAQVQYIDYWSLVKEDYLRSANQTDGLSTYSWQFDWDGDGTYEQNLTLDIDADQTVLYKDGNVQVYPAAAVGNAIVTGITEGATVYESEGTTTVTYSGIQLEWVPMDPAIDRNQDGWWVGIKVAAPVQLTKESDFTNVTYQKYSGGAWSAAESFWDAQESDATVPETERYMTLWGLITPELVERDNDGMLNYRRRFDWNQDGIYEQTLVLTIDSANVKLLKDGIQQFPMRYGTVESLSGGEVSGSGTANSVVTNQKTTLTWSPADPAIGRLEPGWWMGAKITAPADMTKEADFTNVTYQSYENGVWSEARSFWNAQDSDKNAAEAERYLTVWGLITPELVKKDNDGILAYQYRFDWNQDGEYEQQFALELDSSVITLLDENGVQIYPTLGTVTALTDGTVSGSGTGSVTLLVDNVELPWSAADAESGREESGWWIGMRVTAPAGAALANAKYRRKLTGDTWSEAVAFGSDDGSQDTLQLWGSVDAAQLKKYNKNGKNIDYVWQFDWDGDGAFEQTVTMTVVPANIVLKQEGFAFPITADTITYGTNKNRYKIALPEGGQAGANPIYTVSDTTVARVNKDGSLSILKAGTVTITATLSGDYYEDITASYTLTINRAEQTGFAFRNAPKKVTWQEAPLGPLTLINTQGDGDVIWSILGGSDVAEIDSEGKITLLKSGSFTVQAQKKGDDCYADSAVIEATIQVVKANQTGFGFAVEQDEITYNDKDKNVENGKLNQYTLNATGGQSDGAVTYTVSEGNSAYISDNVLTICKSGTVKIRATKAGNDRYNTATEYFTLTINKYEQKFTFGHEKQISESYGLRTFNTLIQKTPYATSKITYVVSENTIGASVNNYGVVSFKNSDGKIGEVTVTVTMEETDCYKYYSDSYTIALGYDQEPAEPYTLKGDQLVDGSDWFTGDVQIYAPKDYQISYSNKLTGNTWKEYVTWGSKSGNIGGDGCADFWSQEENKASAPVVYLKNVQTGAITDAISVSKLKRDTTKPTNLTISYETSVVTELLGKIFGFSESDVEVTVSAQDAMSGIATLEYSTDSGESYKAITKQGEQYKFTVDQQHRGQLWLRATDVAGNVQLYKHLDGDKEKILVLDYSDPAFVVGYTGTMNDNALNGIRYVKGEAVTVAFEITEENYDLRIADPVVTVNGEVKTGWNQDGKLTFTLTDEGDYTISATYTDRLGREAKYESEVIIDRTPPTVESDIENGKYYTEDQTFELKLTEHNFTSENVILSVDAVDSKGKSVLTDAQKQEFADLGKTKWVRVQGTDIYTLQLPVTVDGNYTVTLSYADDLDWSAQTYTRSFTLDKINPDAPKFTYEVGANKGSLIIEKILNKLFGFAGETVTVTVRSGDAVSGIAYMEYKLHNDDTFTKVSMDANGQYTFQLDPEYRGLITAVVYDKAGLSATTVEEKEIVVDSIAPEVSIEFTGDCQDKVKNDTDTTISRETMETPDGTTRFVYNGNVTAVIKVSEANFFHENEDMKLVIYRDNAPVEDLKDAGISDSGWVKDGDNYTRTFVMTADGNYRVTAEYRDHSENDMNWQSSEYGKKDTYFYESNIHTIDTTAPVYKVEYTNNNLIQIRDGREYYAAGRTATITVEDRNFRPSDVLFNVVCTEASDPNLTYADCTLNDWGNWRQAGDVWTATVRFDADANYTVDFAYTDIAGHKMVNTDSVEETYTKQFTVDTKEPTDLKVTYQSKDNQLLSKILDIFTIGNYQAGQEVVLTMADRTAGMDYIALNVTADGDAAATDLKLPEDLQIYADGTVKSGDKGFIGTIRSDRGNDGAVTLTFDVPAQFRGKIDFVAYDKSGNSSAAYQDPGVLVVDTIAPKREVRYTPYKILDKATMLEVSEYEEGDEAILYYKDKADVTFRITEANFDLSLMEAEAKPVIQVNGEAVNVDWVRDGDAWSAVHTITGNGDYVVTMTYKDPSTNEMVEYTSCKIAIDGQAPEIKVEYKDGDFHQEIEGTKFYGTTQTAHVQITDHNFLADDVVLTVTAVDIQGKRVTVPDYAAYAKNRDNWISDGDVHTLKTAGMVFETDAIYTFDIAYDDICDNNADDYPIDRFVVDHCDAESIQITYSTSIPQKLLNLVTFGIYKEKAEVTVTAVDQTAGVDYFVLTYTKEEGSSSVNRETLTETIPAVQDPTNKNVFTATYTLEAQADGKFSVVVFDKANNQSKASNDKRIVVDTKNPVVTAEYQYASGSHNPENNIFYTQGDVTVSFLINEANFPIAKAPVLTVNGEEKSVTWDRTNNEDEWLGVHTLSGDGDYKLKLTFTDASTNVMEVYEQEVRIDATEPVIDVVYNNNDELNENCYKADRIAEITITEHNFKAENVSVQVTAKDILGQDVAVMDYTGYAKNADNWKPGVDVYKLYLPFTVDANYTVTINCTDLAGNNAQEYSTAFVVDHTPADNIQITYSKPVLQKIIENLTFGFYQAEVIVTVTAEDLTSGVDYFNLSYTRDEAASAAHQASFLEKLVAQPGSDAKTFTASYKVPAQSRGSYSVEVFDRAGNESGADDHGTVIITDTVSPKVTVDYAPVQSNTVVGYRDANMQAVNTFGEAANAFYNGDIVATITVHEANFFEGMTAGANNDEIIHSFMIKVTRTDDVGKKTVTEYLCSGANQLVAGAQAKEIKWTSNGDIHSTSIVLSDEGDYVVEISYEDFSKTASETTGKDGNTGVLSYASKTLTVDKTAPVVEVTYDNHSALNENCYKEDRVATIKVTEHNFRAEEFVAEVTAKNILGETVSVTDYAAVAANPADWSHEGNVHTLKLKFETDAIYTFDVAYTDMAGNAAKDYAKDSFVIDHTAADHIQIFYSTPVFEKVMELLSFGFYKADVVVTVTAQDMSAGVDYFELTYTRDEKATEAHTDDFMQKLEAKAGTDAKTFTASYTVPAQARGSYSVKVFDRAGNESSANDHGSVIVTDTVSPTIEVAYAAKNADTKVRFVNSSVQDVDTFAKAAGVFYNGDVEATITVNEANFFEGKKAGTGNDEVVHEIIIKVTKTDDEGKVTVTEYLCAGAKQLVDGAVAKNIVWTTTGDTHTTSIDFAEDGDYVLEITYSDFSKNNAKLSGGDGNTGDKTYTSKTITVDETAPVIQVVYGNTNVINTIDGRDYLDKTQSAVITVSEHNFRAQDIAAVITAKNVIGEDVAVADFAALLANDKNWTHTGNVHTAKVAYTVDANYTFDIDYEDLATNTSADYVQDLFTVDTTAPRNLTISYSTNVFQEILESITFGYYNAQMTVTITAEDDTSGIYHYAYSYINSEGVSSVNQELLDQAIKGAEITFDGKMATATFTVPKMVLGNDNQFNGTVEFTAYDRSELSTGLEDTTRIIVDNISPTSNITYNAPVQTANGISYYNSNIQATITINEANFDAADVEVSVTKNETAVPVNVTWRDENVDTHIGTFTITDDGDYVVSVRYADKSGNRMTSYTSNQLTLDATKPTIKVSNIKANSANKDAEYGFVIEVSDTNMDVSSVKPVLKAVVKREEGVYVTVDVDLGSANTVVSGQTYTYKVENLPDDGFYTLSCEVKDMSANGMSQILLDDEQVYDQVQFSINREGSAYGYGNKFTEELVGQYYIYSVEEDVVIVEVNVDPVENYKVSLNGRELTEGTEYTTSQSTKGDEWCRRTYTIKKDLFADEGEYSIIVSSTDKTETTAFSDVKNLHMAFVVDQTKPVLTITGLTAGGRYRTDEQTVTLIPTDEGGKLSSLSVLVLDSDGNPLKDDENVDISVRFEMSGEDLLKYLEENDGKVTFTVPTGLNNQVRIICNDCAVNADNQVNEYNELFERVTVSQNEFVIFYADTGAFVGTIVGVLAVIALIIFLIKRKKNKK